MDEANSGAFADAAPRASAISSALTGSDVAASSAGLISGMSTPEPTTTTPSGCGAISSAPLTISTSAATASSSSSGRNRWRTSATDPSAVLTTAEVAVSGSTYNTAVCAYLFALPTA